MGIAELDEANMRLVLHATIFLYGNAASDALASDVASDINRDWNHPQAQVLINNMGCTLFFKVESFFNPQLAPRHIFENDNAAYNYFRVENFADGNISFVDGLNSNTGYFLLPNLVDHSTTAAHEFGHTLGLDHPSVLDIRGSGKPGIMYPRGTIVDPHYQYDPLAMPNTVGGHTKSRLPEGKPE